MAEFRTVAANTVAEAAFLRLERRLVEAPDGSVAERVVVVHPGAVAIVPLIDDDVLLFRQHRVPIGRSLLEIPAGKLDVPGEEPGATAVRELEEEIGYTPGKLRHLTDLLTTPGFSDECIHIYVATDLTAVAARPTGIEEHHAEIVRMSLADAVDMARRGAITDAKTVVGLLLAAGR